MPRRSRWLGMCQAARALGVSVERVRLLAAQGRLRSRLANARYYREIDASSIEEYRRERESSPQRQAYLRRCASGHGDAPGSVAHD